jgi:hypothetical protein
LVFSLQQELGMVDPGTPKTGLTSFPSPDWGFFSHGTTIEKVRTLYTELGFGPVAQQMAAIPYEELFSATQINSKGEKGQTHLHFATVWKYTQLAEFLVSKHADVNARDEDGWTPPHVAALSSSRRDITALLLANGADINAKNDFGNTPLDKATEHNNADTVRLLHRYASRQDRTPKGKGPAVPTLLCAECGRSYRIGDDAVAVTLEYGLSLARASTVISDGGTHDREDLVATLDASPENLPGAKENALQNWKIIQDSLSLAN